MFFTGNTRPGPPTALPHSTFKQSYLQHPQISHVSGEMEHLSESPSRTTHLPKFPTFTLLDGSLCPGSEIFKTSCGIHLSLKYRTHGTASMLSLHNCWYQLSTFFPILSKSDRARKIVRERASPVGEVLCLDRIISKKCSSGMSTNQENKDLFIFFALRSPCCLSWSLHPRLSGGKYFLLALGPLLWYKKYLPPRRAQAPLLYLEKVHSKSSIPPGWWSPHSRLIFKRHSVCGS